MHGVAVYSLYAIRCRTSIFTRRADALLNREDRTALITTLAQNPQASDLMPGLSGIRKLGFAPAGCGESGAFRLIHYYAGADLPVLALLIYAKNRQDNISLDQRRVLLSIVGGFKAQRRAARKGTAG